LPVQIKLLFGTAAGAGVLLSLLWLLQIWFLAELRRTEPLAWRRIAGPGWLRSASWKTVVFIQSGRYRHFGSARVRRLGSVLRLTQVLVLFLVMAGALEWFFVIRPTLLRLRQVQEFGKLQVYAEALAKYREDHGHYPTALRDGLSSIEWLSPEDEWCTPLVYQSDGTSFVLASLGKGGQPEFADYSALRDQVPRDANPDECNDLQADQVVTDRGWYRGCGK